MATLTTKTRNAIPTSKFAGPDRSYPIEDKAHARAALSRSSAAYSAGRITEAQHARIAARAHAKLKK